MRYEAIFTTFTQCSWEDLLNMILNDKSTNLQDWAGAATVGKVPMKTNRINILYILPVRVNH